MANIDKLVAQKLKDLHEKQIKKINERRNDLEPFQPGDTVYYRRPEGSGNKLDTRWLGPAIVKAREGERSYLIEVKEGVTIKAHRSFLKKCLNQTFQGQPIPLFYHKRTVIDPEAQVDEWIVEKILRHRINKKGEVEFLTQWKGFDATAATWEPVGNFIHRFNTDFLEYCQNKGIPIDVTRYLHPNRAG